MSDMSNVEALTNICANLSEILGIAGGGQWLVWGWVPTINSFPGGYTRRMLLLGLLMVVMALVTPGFVDLGAQINEWLGLVVGFIFAGIIVPMTIYMFFLPSRIAARIDHPKKTAIQILNWCFFIPLIFGILLCWVTWPQKKKEAPVATATDSTNT